MNTTTIKAVKVSAENASKIEEMLLGVNGKSSAHTYTTAGEIIDLANLAEKKAVRLLGSQKAAVGTVAFSKSGSVVATSYRSNRIGTIVRLERRATGWFLTEADTCTLFADGGYQIKLQLSAEQDTKAIEVLRRQYSVA